MMNDNAESGNDISSHDEYQRARMNRKQLEQKENPCDIEDRRPVMPPKGIDRQRSKYYNRVSRYTKLDSLARPPQHIIHAYAVPSGLLGVQGKQSSLSTIFSIWNTMLGSSLLSIPWAFGESGLLASLLVLIFVGGMCFYTCSLIARHGEGVDDFMGVVEIYLGNKGRRLALSASLLVLFGAMLAYAVLMSNSLYTFVGGMEMAVRGVEPKPSTFWSLQVTPIILGLAIFPVLNLKEFGILVKLNSVGVIFLFYNLAFLLYMSLSHGIDFSNLPPLVLPKFPALAGILSLSFFIHNCILSILKNQRNPENNNRDLGIAFTLVGASYGIIGFAGYLAFHSETIPDNMFNKFALDDPGAIVARGALLFQLFTVFPILVYIFRIQFFGSLYDNPYPGFWHVFSLNAVLVVTSASVAIWYPYVGAILRYTGALTGMIYIYLIPCLLHLRKTYPEILMKGNDMKEVEMFERERQDSIGAIYASVPSRGGSPAGSPMLTHSSSQNVLGYKENDFRKPQGCSPGTSPNDRRRLEAARNKFSSQKKAPRPNILDSTNRKAELHQPFLSQCDPEAGEPKHAGTGNCILTICSMVGHFGIITIGIAIAGVQFFIS